MLGFHHLTGADYGGKFVGISKKRWTDRYLELSNEDPIVTAFGKLGKLDPEVLDLSEDGELHEVIQPLESFVCIGYSKEGV